MEREPDQLFVGVYPAARDRVRAAMDAGVVAGTPHRFNRVDMVSVLVR